MLGVSFNGPFGEVGEERTMRSRGAFVAADSLPVTSVRIATITLKKFTSNLPTAKRLCAIIFCLIYNAAERSLARKDFFIDGIVVSDVSFILLRIKAQTPRWPALVDHNKLLQEI